MSRAFFSHTSLKFIPIINSGARALRIPRLCEAAATDKCIAVRTYVYLYVYPSRPRNRFPVRFNFTPTSAQFSLHGYSQFPNACVSLSCEINARPRAFSYPRSGQSILPYVSHEIRKIATRSGAFTTAIFFILDCLDASSIRNYLQTKIEM